MSAYTLLALRSGAPGLPGPYLEEHLEPYALFDRIGEKTPRILMFIGTTSDVQEVGYGAASRDKGQERTVALRQFDSETLCFECMLHHTTSIPRIKGGYELGSSLHHLMASSDITRMSWAIYSIVLSRFSDAVVIAVSDFGGFSSVIAFLCFYVECNEPSERKIIYIAHETPFDQNRFQFDLAVSMLANLRARNPVETPTFAEVRKLLLANLEIRHLSTKKSSFVERVTSEARTINEDRLREHLVFTALQTKQLLQETISRFAIQPTTAPDLLRLSRSRFPRINQSSEQLFLFMDNFKGSIEEATSILASAFVVDAYPPGMHGTLSFAERRIS